MSDNEEFAHGSFSDVDSSESEDDSDNACMDEDDEQEVDANASIPLPNAETPSPLSNWKKAFQPRNTLFEPPHEPFNLDFGANLGFPRFDILKAFMTDEMIIQICQETNRYAAGVKAKNPNALKDWKDVSSNEMWVFLAINIAMGLLRKPSVRGYWTSNDILSSPFFPKTMSRNRFQHILQCLHLVDNEGVPEENRDRFVKLGDFLPDLLINFRACVNPGEYLCLDESLLGFKGRISFRQYNPKKRSDFGIKFFVLVDCMTHLILDIIPYQGKTTNVSSADIKQFGFGGAAVLALLQPYLHKNHKVVIDNFFNGPILARKLLEAKTFVPGTAQKRRKKMPPAMTSKLAKGQVETFSDGEILVERWHDRREVVMLNTFIPHSMVPSISSNPKNTREKPQSVLVYNKTMGGVDEMDKTIKQYARLRKTYKWYKKVFFFLVDVAIYNSFRVFTSINGTSTYKDYLLELIKEVGMACPVIRIPRGRPSKRPADSPDIDATTLHLPVRVTKADGKASKSRCVHCKATTGERHQTQFKCQTCDVRLCIQSGVSCFEEYHLKLVSKKKRQTDDVPNSESVIEGTPEPFRPPDTPVTTTYRPTFSEVFDPPLASTPDVGFSHAQVMFDVEDYIETDTNSYTFYGS